MNLGIREVSARHIAHVALVVLVFLVNVHFYEALAHFLRLICEGLGAGAGLVDLLLHLLLLLLIVHCVARCGHFVLPNQVALWQVHHALAQ